MIATGRDVAAGRPAAARVPVPKEHGAWFVLLHGILLGAATTDSLTVPMALVAAAAFLTFVSMQGIKQVARRLRYREEGETLRVPRSSVAFLAGAAAVGLAAVLGWNLPVLFLWGGLSVVLAAVYAWLFFHRRDRSVLGEWLGILGLTMAAGAVRTAESGQLDPRALMLWAIAFLYFGHTVPYVKLRVRQLRGAASSWLGRLGEARTALLFGIAGVVIASGIAVLESLPWLLVVPFALALGKVLVIALRGKGPQRLAHVGYAEVAFSTLFVVLTVVSLRWAGWASG